MQPLSATDGSSCFIVTPRRYIRCMSNLIPEQRMDKNNRLVKRWVKPSPQGGSSSSIPAPKAAVETASKETLERLHQVFSDYGFDLDCDFSHTLPPLVEKMPRETADWFVDKAIEHAVSDLLYSINDVVENIYGDSSTVPVEHRETVLQNYVNIIPAYYDGKDDDGIYAAHFAAVVFRGSGGYDSTELYTDDEKHALTKASEVVESIFPVPDPKTLEGTGFKVVNNQVELTDSTSVDLLIKHAHVADGIADVLKRRKVFHPDAIREIAKSPSLSSGIL